MTTPANPDTSNSVGATDDASKGGLLNTGSDTILNGINNAIASNAEAAQTAATAAGASASNAATSATNAATSATTASTKAGEAATDAVNTAADAVNTAADRVQTGLDRTAASTSASNAATSETNAAGSATAAAGSASSVAANATAAAASETAAAASETAAATSETNAATSASTASTKASEASTSATNAASSATAASTAQTAAETAETNAETAETNAEAAETNAANSATAAANSATAAATSATNASNSASSAATSETNAATSETNAATSASTASTQATNAANSASSATTSATNASNSASAASTSEANAAASESAAAASETAAASSETNAATSASTASTQATNASTSATAAATSATASATSATASETAKTASEAARDQALAAFDNFDDKYLGEKSADPTVDNDGDPLQAGMLYFNTTNNVMKVYTGSAWVAAYVSGQGFASLSGADFTGAITAPSINLASTTLVNSILDEDNMASNSATALSTQQAIKSYVDTQVATVPVGDITAVTAGTGLSGGGTSGAVTLDIDSTVATLTGTQTLTNKTLGATSVTGNLTFTGAQTVDGRDVSVDGTKLDTIETNADVTDTTNVTAAGALMDSEVTNLAQVKAFDSSDYATAAQGTLASSALQSGDNVSVLTNNAGYLTSVPAQSFSSLTGKPTTISGYGITDAFDGAYASLTGKPTIPTNNNQLTNGAGYITSVPAQSFASLTSKPTTISGYGITDAFDGAYGSLTGTPTIPTNNNQLTNGAGYITSVPAQSFSSLTGKPTTISGYGITDVVGQFTAGTGISIAANGTIANTIPATTSASDLTSGTLPDARFPATLPAISGANLTNLPGGADLYTANPVSATDPVVYGNNSIAIGSGASASYSNAAKNDSLAIGTSALTTGIQTVAIGKSANALGDFATAVGPNARARKIQSTAIGQGAYVDEIKGVAVGANATCYGEGAVSLGSSYASGDYAFAATITTNGATYGARGHYSTAIGRTAKAGLGTYTIAMGYSSLASGNNGVAIGTLAIASHTDSMSLGYDVSSTAANQVNLAGSTQTVRISEAYTLPTADGTNGQVMTTDGSGAVTFADAGGGGFDADFVIADKTATYTVVAGDAGKVLTHSANDITFNLTAAATLGAGFHVWIKNEGASGDITSIDPNGSETLDGRAIEKLFTGESIHIYTDGSNWYSLDRTIMWVGNTATDYYARPLAAGGGAIAGGLQSSASGVTSVAVGYTASATANGSVALGSSANATANRAVAIGWSKAGGSDSFSAAITNSSASYGASSSSSVAIGRLAKASGSYSTAIANSAQATATGSMALGEYARASGTSSCVISTDITGDGTLATASQAIAIGANSKSATIGKIAHSSKRFAANGDAQGGIFVLLADTTDATATVLTTNNATAAADNQIVAASDTCIMFSGTLVAMQNGAQDQGGWEIKGLLKNDGGTTTLVSSNIQTFADGNGWVVALTADNTNNALAITCTGEASHNIRWVANISTSEVTYA